MKYLNEKEVKVGKDDEEQGNSASEQNQKDMEEKIKEEEKIIEKQSDGLTEDLDKKIKLKDVEKSKTKLERFLKKGYKRILDEEEKSKKDGPGPTK